MAQDASAEDDEIGLLRVLSSMEYIRAIAQEKREMLLQSGQRRVNIKKYIYVISGSLALISGGAASSLVAPAADFLGVKIVAAALAFVSGAISLVTTAFFDEKETAKINEGAGRYGELRDRADIVLNSRDRNLAQIDTAFRRLTESQTTLQQAFDLYINVDIIRAKSSEIQTRLNTKLQEAQKAIEARSVRLESGRATAGGGAAGGGGGFTIGRPIDSGMFQLGPSFNTWPSRDGT